MIKDIRLVLLGLLQQGELYGYQIKKRLEQSHLGAWVQAPIASIYHELNQMADEGLIERGSSEPAAGRPARVIYRITEQGRNTLHQALLDTWSNVETRVEIQDLAMLFMHSLTKTELETALKSRLQNLYTELAAINERANNLERSDERWPLISAVHNHMRIRQESEITWVNKLLTDIEHGVFILRPELTPAPQGSTPGGVQRQAAGKGAFTFVLHTHLPYCRLAGRWPHGEEWIHQALAETYVPLLNALFDLREEHVPFRLTTSLTPVLTEQLADQDIREHFVLYLDEQIAAATRDIPRFGESGEGDLETLAIYYRDFFTHIKSSFLDRFGGDVISAYRQLQDEGYLEIITSAATHGYLPLLSRDSSIYGQLRAGVESYRRHFGRAPRAIWLPECAYRPAYLDDDGTIRPGIEEFLASLGITTFLVETHAIEGGHPVGKAADEVSIGPYGGIKRHYLVPQAEVAGSGGTTFKAYYVASRGGLTKPPVAAIGRNNRTGQQVWSAEWGYPGEGDYREFHKKDAESGMQYWRVTGPKVDLGNKQVYHPEYAEERMRGHAAHYAHLVEQLVSEYADSTQNYGIISSNYDTELFGHWWFEGVSWLREVLRNLAASPTVDLTTISAYVANHEPAEMMAIPESSWGSGGYHWTWDNDDTHWMWQPIHAAEEAMEQLTGKYPYAEGAARQALNQAARELLLVESSDWPFLVTTGQAKEYAVQRFESHLARFKQLIALLNQDKADEAANLAATLYELDKVFPQIDYRWFTARQGNPV
ncbi:MAG: 1,4-alpha-glucan branching protein domain-containing protein [Anaerolineae bacterium]